MAKQTSSAHQRANSAEAKSAMWLNRGREAEERGNKARAEDCYEKAGYWLDRANELRGLSSSNTGGNERG